MSDIKLKFEAAVEVIKNLPKNQTYQPSNELMLRFYSLYKQAVFGKCNIPRPGFWDVVGRAKWDAWNNIGNISSNQAMTLYVEELKKVIETMPHSADVGNFLQTLGSFYEVVDINYSEENDNELNVYQQVDLKIENNCESSVSDDKCSETSFYEVAPTFFGDFDAMETIKRLQDDIETLNQRVKALESNHTETNHCICRMFIRFPRSQYKIPLFIVAGLSIALSPILWIIIARILRVLRRRRHLKISNI